MTDVQDNPVVIDGSQKPVGFIIAVLIGFVLLYSIFTADIEIATPSSLSLADLGSNIFTQFLIPFLLLGILLDIALTGALLNGKKHKNC